MKLKTKNSKLKTIGIELPFGWCLVRKKELQEIQSNLREARNQAKIRLKRLTNIYNQKNVQINIRK